MKFSEDENVAGRRVNKNSFNSHNYLNNNINLYLSFWRFQRTYSYVNLVHLSSYHIARATGLLTKNSSLLLYIEWFSLSAKSKRYVAANWFLQSLTRANLRETKLQHCRLRQLLCRNSPCYRGEPRLGHHRRGSSSWSLAISRLDAELYRRPLRLDEFGNSVTRKLIFESHDRGKFTPANAVSAILLSLLFRAVIFCSFVLFEQSVLLNCRRNFNEREVHRELWNKLETNNCCWYFPFRSLFYLVTFHDNSDKYVSISVIKNCCIKATEYTFCKRRDATRAWTY